MFVRKKLQIILGLPSEHRYSASLVRGLAFVHIVLSTLGLFFSIGAVLIEEEWDHWACLLWTAPGLLCGLCGILASRRWYVDYQILIFLAASIISAAASILCLYVTAAGIQFGQKRISSVVVTVNVLVTASLESVLSIVSVLFGLKGSLSPPYNFSSPSIIPK